MLGIQCDYLQVAVGFILMTEVRADVGTSPHRKESVQS